jgi:tetratricopeptide (TPR) repeat protein
LDSLRTTFFVGREPFLQRLQSAFVDHQLVVVAGRSGMGKTAVLREYVQRFSQQYQVIIWFNAATDETFLADLIAALQTYALPIDIAQGVAHLFDILQNYLSEQQNTLLIIDNFAYNFAVQGLSERQPAVHTIVSTHAPQTPPEIPRLELTGLDAQDGAVLLLHQAGLLAPEEGLNQAADERQPVTLELSHELRGLPITLNLVGRYLRMTGSSVQDYLAVFRAHPIPLHLSASSDPSATEEFAIACECSLTYLKETNPAALELLQMVALLLPEAIPGALFQSQTEPPANDAVPEQSISQILLAAGFIAADQQTTLWTMHRLIQNIVLQTLSEDEKQQCIKQILYLWQKQLPKLQSESLSLRLQMAGQIRHLATISESESAFFDALKSDNEAADVFAWAASLFWEQHLVGMAEPLLRRALKIWHHTLGNAHPMVATILANLATMNRALKNYVDAEAFAHRAIVSKSSALGINHPDVLLTLDQLGHIYAEQGKLKEARQCYEKALTIGDTVDLSHNPIYNTVRYDLALLYIEQENWGRAAELLRRVSIGRMSMLGAEDPGTIEAFSHLAEVCIRQKNWQMAQVAYKRILSVQERSLGVEHPTILHHLEQEANVFLHLGKIAEAKQHLQRVQEVKERTLGKEHSNLIICLNGLAQVALAEKEYSAGLALLTRAQQIYAQQSESEPLVLATLLDTTAAIELAQQHFEQATSLYKQALDISIQVMKKKRLELIDPLEHLAKAYSAQEKYDQAKEYLSQALTIYQEAERPEDMLLDPVLNSLAEIEIACTHPDLASSYLDRSRGIRELALGKNDPRTVAIVEKLASIRNTHV